MGKKEGSVHLAPGKSCRSRYHVLAGARGRGSIGWWGVGRAECDVKLASLWLCTGLWSRIQYPDKDLGRNTRVKWNAGTAVEGVGVKTLRVGVPLWRFYAWLEAYLSLVRRLRQGLAGERFTSIVGLLSVSCPPEASKRPFKNWLCEIIEAGC